MNRLLAALGTALLVAGVLSGCTSLEGSGGKGYVSQDGRLTLVDRPDRDQPVDLSGEDLDGRPLALADLRGKPTVVTVWGSWCAPCHAEAPDLVGAAKELGDTAHFVGIDNRDGSPAQAKSFVRRYDVPYPSFYSPDGRALLSFVGTLSPNSVPATVVLDAEGRVAASINGSLPSEQTLVDVVRDVADGTADGTSADG